MTTKHRNPAIARAAAAAALAALLAACGKSVTVTGGGGGEDAPPAEERLFLRGGVPLPSVRQQLPGWVRERANWTPTAAQRAGPDRRYTDLIPLNQRQIIDPAKVSAAAGLRPSFAQNAASYTRSAPHTRLSPDYGAFWQEYASDTGAQASRVNYFASSGVSQSSRGASGSVHDRVHVEIGAIDPLFGNKPHHPRGCSATAASRTRPARSRTGPSTTRRRPTAHSEARICSPAGPGGTDPTGRARESSARTSPAGP